MFELYCQLFAMACTHTAGSEEQGMYSRGMEPLIKAWIAMARVACLLLHQDDLFHLPRQPAHC